MKYDKNDMSIDPNRSFFCSELIAKAYKSLGIIEDGGKACSSYFPKHFSKLADSQLKFLNGCKLGEEQ
jgi:hypothetical protein